MNSPVRRLKIADFFTIFPPFFADKTAVLFYLKSQEF